MNKTFWKFLYIFTRGTSIFSLPFIRRVRVKAYENFFNCKNFFIGESVIIVPSHLHTDSSIHMGNHVSIASFTLIDYSGHVNIGDYCTISEGVKIYSHTHKLTEETLEIKKTKIVTNTLNIDKYVWIGANSVILPSVRKIGLGAVVGAGSIVTKDVDDYAIVVGNPAKQVAKRAYPKDLV